MLIQATKGDLYSLLQEMQIIQRNNANIPARLDIAIDYAMKHNKTAAFALNEEVKKINDKFVAKDEEGKLKMVVDEENKTKSLDIKPDDQILHKQEMEELMMQPVQINVQQVMTADLGHITFNKQFAPFEAFKRIMIKELS